MPVPVQPQAAASAATAVVPNAAPGSRIAAMLERNVFMLCVLAMLGLFQTQLARFAVIGDTWYGLVSGRLIVHSGLPERDSLTVLTLGRTWVDQQWLAHLALYAMWRGGGFALTSLAVVLMYGGAFVVTAAGARRLGASDRSVALVLAVCFFAGLPNSGLRAQIFAYPLFALVLVLLLADARQPSRRVYLVLPLLVLWANVHGSAVLGAALVALRGLTIAFTALRQRAAWRAWAPRAATLVFVPWLCMLASPYGLDVAGYYRSVLDNSTLARSVGEWGPSTLRGQPYFFALLLAGLWLGTRWSKPLTPFAQLALWFCGIAGLLALRNQVWFALAATAVLPASLDGAWRPANAPRRRGLNLALALTALAVLTVVVARAAAHHSAWYADDFPAGAHTAVAGAARTPNVRILATERYADWLLFEEPQLAGRLAYDARLELLTAQQLRDVVDFRYQKGVSWQRLARGYRVLVLDPDDDRNVVRFYAHLPGTAVLYRDKKVVVLERPR
jgi:hypothetical protein